MYISFLLQLAFVWNSAQPNVREVLEQEEFILKFAKDNLNDDTVNHNTLNNGPNEKEVLETNLQFKNLLMAAYDELKPVKPEQVRKKNKDTIPANRKTEVWNKYIGETIGKAKCLCCLLKDITAREFVAGHVIPEDDGGSIDVDNLRPICAPCNASMGPKNMISWMRTMYPNNKFI